MTFLPSKLLTASLGLPPMMASLHPVGPTWLTAHMDVIGRWVMAASVLPHAGADLRPDSTWITEVHGGHDASRPRASSTSLLLLQFEGGAPPAGEALLRVLSPEGAYRGVVCTTGRLWQAPPEITRLLLRGAHMDARAARADMHLQAYEEDMEVYAAIAPNPDQARDLAAAAGLPA